MDRFLVPEKYDPRITRNTRNMLRVGLTGSIAVGKTFVTGVLAELGCHVLDADELAR